ncbi:LOW QUALITY PROTEIN: prominin-2-like [Colossoma macropomum]|uniref:LOW QUALITY PROTEIN: prominin-2-like n=1 Tax=Colossoma macropomum TaxID=42526 RepID=UPI0018640E43|nr:LOW QUALITY PROTEIN: prominin-2-like [Colossoma macropomum]
MLALSSRMVLVLLWLAVVSSTALTECFPDRVDPEYQLNLIQAPPAPIQNSAGSLEPLYNFARLFLLAVQPYGFPLDTASRVSQNEATSSEVIRYEAGYMVCLILAVLYVVAIPVAGIVLVWRYFHYKKMPVESQPSPSSLPWYQRNVTVITCLSVVVILLLCGVILTFTTNNKMRQNMQPNLSRLRTDIGNIEKALNSVPQKVDSIVDKFSVFQEELMEELEETGDLIGQTILSSLNPNINIALDSLRITVQDATGAQRHLLEVKELRENMQATYALLKTELTEMQKRLDKLNSTLDTSTLTTDAKYDLIPSVDHEVQQISFVSVFYDMEEQVETLISSIPGICADQSTPQIEGLLVYLNKVHTAFRNNSKRLPSLRSLLNAVSNVRAALDKSKAGIDYYDYVRWSVSVAFCTLILIISLLMLAGLVIGASMVISPTLYPFYLENQLRLTTVYLLYVASGMIFVFSWLFIIMVFINLFFGGNAHALVCRSCTNGETFEFLDKQALFSSLDAEESEDMDIDTTTAQSPTMSTANNSTDVFTNLTDYHRKQAIKTFEIYQGCQRGRSMFYSMHMNETFNMNKFLNASMYLRGFDYSMHALNFDLSTVQLLPDNARIAVQLFRDFSNLDQIKYNNFRTLLASPIVKTDLDTFAAQLETAALTANGTNRENLTSEAAKARQLANTVRLQDSYRRNMSSSIEALATIRSNYQANADNTLLNATEVESSLQLQVPDAVQNVSRCVMERATELLRQYFVFVKYAIIDEALECSWLPVSLSNMYTATCENLIGPWNAFWLSLGWCCAFLIPGVIFSILAARLWKPPTSPVNRERFHMPDDIFDKGTNTSCMTLGSLKGKRTEGNTYKRMEEPMDFKKNGDTKKTNFNIYMTLDDVISFDKGKKEKGGCSA